MVSYRNYILVLSLRRRILIKYLRWSMIFEESTSLAIASLTTILFRPTRIGKSILLFALFNFTFSVSSASLNNFWVFQVSKLIKRNRYRYWSCWSEYNLSDMSLISSPNSKLLTWTFSKNRIVYTISLFPYQIDKDTPIFNFFFHSPDLNFFSR